MNKRTIKEMDNDPCKCIEANAGRGSDPAGPRRLQSGLGGFRATLRREVIALEEQDYGSSNDAIRAIDDKTRIIVGDADGVQLEHAIELFRLRGGGDRQAAAQGFIAGAPRARLAILPATSHIGLMAEAERIALLATPFLDDHGPPRATGFFEGVDTPSGPGNVDSGKVRKPA